LAGLSQQVRLFEQLFRRGLGFRAGFLGRFCLGGQGFGLLVSFVS